MYSMLIALSILRRHCIKINKLDTYRKIYNELENLNFDDDARLSKATETIASLLYNDEKLAKMLIYLIQQRKTIASEVNAMATKIDSSAATHAPLPEPPNLSQRILKAVQKILPKTQTGVNTEENLIPVASSVRETNETAPTSSNNVAFPKQSSYVTLLNSNGSVNASVTTSRAEQTVTNVFKLVPLGKNFQSQNKNAKVLPSCDNFMELHPQLAKQSKDVRRFRSVVTTTETFNTNITTLSSTAQLRAISKSSPASSDNSEMANCFKVSSPSAFNIIKKKTVPKSNINKQPVIKTNTIQSLLNAAKAVDKMSNVNSGFSLIKPCEGKNLKRGNEIQTNFDFTSESSVSFISQNESSIKKQVTEGVFSNAQEPLDFSFPKNKNKPGAGYGTSWGENSTHQRIDSKVDEDDDDALIIVDDDEDDKVTAHKKGDSDPDDSLLADKSDYNHKVCNRGNNENAFGENNFTINETKNQKSEQSSQEETLQFLDQLIKNPCNLPLKDIDSPELSKNKRKRKRKQLLLDDEFY